MTTRAAEGIDPRLRRTVSLREARGALRSGDLILWRDVPGLASYLIRVAGGTRYSHAAMLLVVDGIATVAEVREWYGGRMVTLASQVRRFSGHLDVFTANPADRFSSFDRVGAARYMIHLAGCHYGWPHVALAAIAHLPVVRCFAPRPSENDLARSKWPPFCSEAVAAAYRVGGGVDPVPWRADRVTEPADLARSIFFSYRFTLTATATAG